MIDARAAILELLAARPLGATICPSEAARAIAPESDWRPGMAEVHGAVDKMLAEGIVELSWKGRALDARRGPYRIGARSRM